LALGEGDMHGSLPLARGLGTGGNWGREGVTGESGRVGEGVESESPRGGSVLGMRRGKVPSGGGRSSLVILICCLTAVSLNCPR
jgi:hypothetical protein